MLTVHTDTLSPDEVADVGGIAVTTPARTAFDIGRRTTSRLQAVQRLDALTNATDVKINEIEAVMVEHSGARGWLGFDGCYRLSTADRIPAGIANAASADRRGTSTTADTERGYDDYGDFVPRIDMGYEELRVGIEDDGPQHWTSPEQRDRDIDRYTALLDLGWTIIRVSSELLRYRQGTFVARVVAALEAAGWHQ